MKIDNAIASIAVKDLKAASAWYEKLFGRPADSTPMPEVAEWKFERGGWLQVYELAERAGAAAHARWPPAISPAPPPICKASASTRAKRAPAPRSKP